jgi:hypothetical protein
MNDEDLIGYILDLLEPDEHAAVALHIENDPAAATHLSVLREQLAPLDADAEDSDPPVGLATRTLSRLAAYLVENEPRTPTDHNAPTPSTLPSFRHAATTDQPEPRSVGGRFRIDLIVAAGLAFFAIGLGLSVVSRLRQQNENVACQNNLRALHAGLTTYADTHDGRFPQVGAGPYPTAGSFVPALVESGQIPGDFRANCPAAARKSASGTATDVPYTYTLGYRGLNGELVGLRRATDAENDLIPICADCPAAPDAPSEGPMSPHVRGQNVLFVGGNVRFATTATVGLNGDHIYKNFDGRVAAGLARGDAVLGRSGDMP